VKLELRHLRALASRTRIKILREVADQRQPTVTSLSQELNLSKSTISEHLDHLVEAEIVDREEEQDRRRVVYQPTKTGERLASGKKVPVKLAAAGILSLTASAATYLQKGFTSQASAAEQLAAPTADTEAAETAATGTGSGIPELLALLGAILLIASALLHLKPKIS